MGWMDPVDHGQPAGLVTRLARTAGVIALAGLLAACASSASSSNSAVGVAASSSNSAVGVAGSAPAASPASGSAPAPAPAGAFVPIVEPFDPGHPARTGPTPASCDAASATLGIERCYDARTENADAAIDTVQLARYASATAAGKAAIVAQDSTWLAARQPVCAVAYHAGGTVDGIDIAICLFDESTTRLDGLKGITPPSARLNGTDSFNPDQLSWYTTAEGSRVAEINTQGDSTGGAIVAWVIIGGADGFVVNPRQFYFQDKSFIDHGVIQPPDPTGHRVAPGQEYQFGLDYSHLSADPNANKSAAAYLYAPATQPPSGTNPSRPARLPCGPRRPVSAAPSTELLSCPGKRPPGEAAARCRLLSRPGKRPVHGRGACGW